MHTLGFTLFVTPVGCCGIAWSAAGLTGVQLPQSDENATRQHMVRRFPGAGEITPPAAVAAAMRDVIAVLSGTPPELATLEHIALDLDAVPPFYQRVYAAARQIAPGKTLSYGELARSLGEPGAARAVGQALGHNPFAPVVPCHRVLAAGGRAGGFSAHGGVDLKLRLLLIERAQFGSAGLFDDHDAAMPKAVPRG